MSLRILNLQADNYKRLRAVDITPEGNVIFIGGRNAQGKTSVLDAIWSALAGGEASKANRQPIREGQDSAVVRLDLGEYIVTRRWTKDGDAGTLTVTASDGAKYSSPQALLDKVIGARAFDPLAFTRLSPKEQVTALVSLVTLPFDPATLERERQGVFDRRTDANRAVKQLEGALASLPKPPADVVLPAEEVPIATLLAEYNAAQDSNRIRSQLEQRVGETWRVVNDAERAVQAAQSALAAAKSEAVTVQQQFANAPEAIDVEEIAERLDKIDATNSLVRDAREVDRVAKNLADKKEEAAKLTIELGSIEKRKTDALAAVEFPDPRLSFDQTGVTYDGVPFGQASAAEQLRASVALAMASNPTLRVLRILDGSLLDSASMQIVAEMAAENDYQVWVEVVDETGSVGITIEDGAVRS